MDRDPAEKLLTLFQELSIGDQAAVTSFAEFLRSRSGSADTVSTAATDDFPQQAAPVPEPESIPRPQGEKVVAAVKRLSKTYFMLDKSSMLGVTSDLVTQHIMGGRDAVEVIDELEIAFLDQYRKLKAGDN